MIKFHCRHCHQKIGVKPEAAGKRVKCPKCQAVVSVPRSSAVSSAPAPPAPPPASAVADPHDRRPATQRAAVAEAAAPPPPPPAPAADTRDPYSFTNIPPALGAALFLLILLIPVAGALLMLRASGDRQPGIEILSSDDDAALALTAGTAAPGDRPSAGRPAPGGLRHLITLPGHLPERHAWRNNGFGAIGDANGDGHTDFVVSAASHHMGALTAYSGRDGTPIWQVDGYATDRDTGDPGFFIRELFVVHDLDGDGVRDIYVREDWGKQRFRVFSGRDGSILVDHAPPPIPDHLAGPTRNLGDEDRATRERMRLRALRDAMTPDRLQDVTGDGTPDIVRIAVSSDPGTDRRRLEWRAYSGHDFSLIEERFIVPPGPEQQRLDWRTPELHDATGDDVADYLAESLSPDGRWFILAAADLSLVREIPITHRLGRISDMRYTSLGDIDGDGAIDIVIAEKANASGDVRLSHLSAISGATGERIWELRGDAVPGTLRTQVPVSGEAGEVESWTDAGFGTGLLRLPDLNGDGVGELAVAVNTEYGNTFDVLIVSGASGRQLARLSLAERQGTLIGSHMGLLDSVDGAGQPGLLINARSRATGENQLALFALPDLR